MRIHEITQSPVEDAFHKWFAGSVIVNPDGSPHEVFHGTVHEFDTFRPNQGGLIFFSFGRSTAREFSLIHDASAKWGIRSVRIIHAYLKVEHPFDHTVGSDVETLVRNLNMDAVIAQKYEQETSSFKKPSLPQHIENLIRQGSWPVIELPIVIDTIKALGYDGILLKEFGKTTIAVFDPKQVWITPA
jgi:hypothetical protein